MKVPPRPPRWDALFGRVNPDRLPTIIAGGFGKSSREYPHWERVLRVQPPGDLSREEWWLAIKFGRQANRTAIPLVDSAGHPFSFGLPAPIPEKLHRIDQQASGRIAMVDTVANPATRDRYLIRSLEEEAIRSSQLEGASTTRKVARDMLRTGRTPRNRSERMIANNYRAMRFVGELRDQPLTPERVCELQQIVTEGTLDEPQGAGKLQRPGEVRVQVWDGDEILHTPPPAEQLPSRLERLCQWANDPAPDPWVHPVVRAILLHFWLAYDHPFEDGNGRTARALFYWSMLRQGYWLAEFLSISTVLREAPARYARAFLHTETDDNDLTYFLLHQLEVIGRAIESFEAYLHRKVDEVRTVEALLAKESMLNHRQRAVLGQALRDPSSEFTMAAHRATHNVVYQTARTDLLGLARLALLNLEQRGREFVFTVPADLSQRLRKNTNY